MRTAAYVVFAGLPNLAALLVYFAWRNRPLLRARRSTAASLATGSGMLILQVSMTISVTTKEEVYALFLSVTLATGSLICYAGMLELLINGFRLYHKLDSYRMLRGTLRSTNGTTQFSSANTTQSSAESSSDADPARSCPQKVNDSNNQRLLDRINHPCFYAANLLAACLGLVFGIVVPHFFVADDPLFTCTGTTCWYSALMYTAVIVVGSGVPIVTTCFQCYAAMGRSSKLYGQDSLGIKSHIRTIALAVSLLQFSTVLLLAPVGLGVLERDYFFIAEAIGFHLIFIIVIYWPLICEHRMSGMMTARPIQTATELLRRFLADRENRRAFKTHLESEFCSELLMFFEQAAQFKLMFERHSVQMSKVKESYATIRDTFLLPTSELELNLSVAVTRKFRQSSSMSVNKISPGGDLAGDDISATVFDEAIEEVLQVMSADPLLRFEQSATNAERWRDFLEKQEAFARNQQDLADLAAAHETESVPLY
eukprot:CAMPEP_0202093834 /NCGR_PEP_ID=MMETSP0964-20121228/48734_1 /ASSEMBLY_ACC=CAM_ASM_000500 /TAXON_ID=4773 /ORGANISM="Schizochytrium aggregatum, Strain ATCC28209" /LENGTH=483 /DNA_ID=CAMNT_0048662087 /DNA_START=80 /DNA_END=1531 /DNA_ORIENTATION=+